MPDTHTQGKLGALFDLQRFAANARLGKLIAKAESAAVALDDDELCMVSAAGDVDAEPSAGDDENGDKKA